MLSEILDQFKDELEQLRDLRKKRLEICDACPELTDGWRCRVCGCPVIGKVSISNQSCPLKKW